MNTRARAAAVAFTTLDETYFADSCEPLTAAVDARRVALSALARGPYPGAPIPDDRLDGLRTIGFWDATADQNWGLDWHRNEGIEITFLASGSVGFAVDDDAWTLHAGDFTVTRPWQQHRVGLPDVSASKLQWLIIDVGVRGPNQVWNWPEWIALSAADLERLTELLQHNEHAVWRGTDALAKAFARAMGATEESSEFQESELRIVISALLLEVLRALEGHHLPLDHSLTAPIRGVRLFLRDLDQQLQRSWSLQSMAQACGMGRTQFSRHCHSLTNMSPLEYLGSLRMNRAAELLAAQDLSITDIAFECGFESSQYFATCFRKAYAESPSAYRKRVHAPAP